ncbi:hypothetical protein B0H11DRAFT_1987812 [Mycena galericulata]|nr:hypothetical protein B0H11DRAFT_1987812 [Mycena galericulata]
MATLNPFPPLPVELQDLIFGWLGPSDLRSISLASRRMNEVVQRRLLHHVTFSLTKPLVNFVGVLTPKKVGHIKAITLHRRIYEPCTEEHIDHALAWLLRWTAAHLVSLSALDTMVLRRPPMALPLQLNYPRLRELTVVADHPFLEAALPDFLRGHRHLHHLKIIPMYRLSAPRSPLPAFDLPELSSLECPLPWAGSFGDASTRVLFASIAASVFDPQMSSLAQRLALSPLGLNLVSVRLSGAPPHILACLYPVVRHCRRICEITLSGRAGDGDYGPPQLNVPSLFSALSAAPQLLRVAYRDPSESTRSLRPDDALPVARFDLCACSLSCRRRAANRGVRRS